MSGHPLLRLLHKPGPLRVLGLMSGTSLDGLDCALVDLDGQGLGTQVRGVRARTYPYDQPTRARLLRLCRADAPLPEVCAGSFWLGEVFAQGVLRFLADEGLDAGSVDLIGSHGQTVWHQPPSSGAETPATLQIGEPAVIRARTGIVTVADFRVADVAHGGEGAPLVPYCDFLLYRVPGRLRALQNIGGIANVTVVGERLEQLIAFDNAPGNLMLDALAERASGGRLRCDQDGALSRSGQVQEDVLAELLADPYLQRPPPKSTGRERYGAAATERLCQRHPERRAVDLLATAVELSAQAIASSLRPFAVDEVLVAGGGAHNPTLMGRLKALLAPVPLRPFAEGGADVDCKEAVAFAVLAAQAVYAQPANLPQVTGARAPAVLGKICL